MYYNARHYTYIKLPLKFEQAIVIEPRFITATNREKRDAVAYIFRNRETERVLSHPVGA